MDNNQVASQMEARGLILLEKWIQETFVRFSTYRLGAKANIQNIFNEIDQVSEEYLNAMDNSQLIAIFIVSLKLRGFRVLSWTSESLGENLLVHANVLSSVNSSRTIATLTIGPNIEAVTTESERSWKVLRSAQDKEDQDALQRVLIALASLAFILEYIEGVESVNRTSFLILEQVVAVLSYPHTSRNRIRGLWNKLQHSKENGSSHIF